MENECDGSTCAIPNHSPTLPQGRPVVAHAAPYLTLILNFPFSILNFLPMNVKQKEVCPADLFSYLLRQHKMCQHGDTEDNTIPAEHLEIVLLDEAHQEPDDEQ